MPTYTRGKLRDKTVYVKANASLYYGWRTKDLSQVPSISAADLTALGHISALPANAIACFGANAPKPPRVSKRLSGATATTQANIGTFCGYDKLAAALVGGWSLAKDGRAVSLSTTARTVIAVAEVSAAGVLYAFPMNAADFGSYAAELGLKSNTSVTTASELARLVRASTYPQPGRAAKRLATGTVSSFYSYDKQGDLQAAGWTILSNPRLLSTPVQQAP